MWWWRYSCSHTLSRAKDQPWPGWNNTIDHLLLVNHLEHGWSAAVLGLNPRQSACLVGGGGIIYPKLLPPTFIILDVAYELCDLRLDDDCFYPILLLSMQY